MGKAKAKGGAAPAALKGESFDVFRGRQYIRTYSLEDHGDAFRANLEEFTTKNAGLEIVPSESVDGLTVEYREKSKLIDAMVDKTKVFSGGNFRADAVKFANEVKGTVVR